MVASNEPRDDANANAQDHTRELLSPPSVPAHLVPQEFDAIKAQRMAMQQQLEAYKADSAAQLKATEVQTLELLNGLVERLETDRGKLRVDQEEVRQQVRNIEAALQHELSAQMRAKMDELMELASRGEYDAYDPKLAGVKRVDRDTDKE